MKEKRDVDRSFSLCIWFHLFIVSYFRILALLPLEFSPLFIHPMILGAKWKRRNLWPLELETFVMRNASALLWRNDRWFVGVYCFNRRLDILAPLVELGKISKDRFSFQLLPLSKIQSAFSYWIPSLLMAPVTVINLPGRLRSYRSFSLNSAVRLFGSIISHVATPNQREMFNTLPPLHRIQLQSFSSNSSNFITTEWNPNHQ